MTVVAAGKSSQDNAFHANQDAIIGGGALAGKKKNKVGMVNAIAEKRFVVSEHPANATFASAEAYGHGLGLALVDNTLAAAPTVDFVDATTGFQLTDGQVG